MFFPRDAGLLQMLQDYNTRNFSLEIWICSICLEEVNSLLEEMLFEEATKENIEIFLKHLGIMRFIKSEKRLLFSAFFELFVCNFI